MTGTESRSTEEALASAVVRIRGQDGAVCGAGALVAPERVARLEEVWFGPDGNTLVATQGQASGAKSSLVTVDIGAATMRELASGLAFSGTGVSGDGGVAVVCQEERPDPNATGTAHYQVIRVTDGRVLRRYDRGSDTSCADVAVAEKGERFAVRSGAGSTSLVDTTAETAAPTPFISASLAAAAPNLPLLGTAREPVLVTQSKSGVTGWAMVKDSADTAYSPPKLLGDGSRMVVRVGRNGESLRVAETEGEDRTLAEVNNTAETPPDAKQEIQVNGAETLMADVSNRNRITIRELPSLRQVSEFTAADPAAGRDGKPELLEFHFLDDDRLFTVSGTRVEYWDVREGRRLSQPFDLRDLQLTTKDQPTYFVGRHPEPGHVGVTVQGEPDAYAVDLTTGKENEELRLRLGADLNVAVFLKDPRYAAVMTTGSMVELWSVRPGQTPRRVAGPLGPLNPNRWAAGIPGGAGFYLANDSSVNFLRADGSGYRETYQFADRQGFLAAPRDGKALLRTPVLGGRMTLFRLDPALWKRHLCAVVGRQLTADERGSLPSGLPAEICPAP
ncbi:hypothetical protein ACIQU4_21025 [Streptomyces sp. NPDC090741]|uniref:hypothetical protein n=1 Tax=Streptomyces sp. NPDC090741 TaxID=3365967 RepID=UPI0037F635A1